MVGEEEIDGVSVSHYRATGSNGPNDGPQYGEVEYGSEDGASFQSPGTESYEPSKMAISVHRGPEDYSIYLNIIDLWVSSENGILVKADLMRIEQAPPYLQTLKKGTGARALDSFQMPTTSTDGGRSGG